MKFKSKINAEDRKSRLIFVRVRPALDAQIKEAAGRYKTSRSEVIRVFIEHGLKQLENNPERAQTVA